MPGHAELVEGVAVQLLTIVILVIGFSRLPPPKSARPAENG
jgi:hypothetical protein